MTSVELDLAPAWQNLATVLTMQQDSCDAPRAIENLLMLQPRSLHAQIMRSDVQRNLRLCKRITTEYRRMIAEFPESGQPWFGYSNLKNVSLCEGDAARMLAQLPRVSDERERVSLSFALAKVPEDVDNCEEAIATLIDANAGMRCDIA